MKETDNLIREQIKQVVFENGEVFYNCIRRNAKIENTLLQNSSVSVMPHRLNRWACSFTKLAALTMNDKPARGRTLF